MNSRNPSNLRTLLLLMLVIGPLQAQTLFACTMMDTVVVDHCCCDHPQSASHCGDSNADSALATDRNSCCEQSVVIGVDQETRQDAALVKQIEVRSNVDPPAAIVTAYPDLAAFQSQTTLGVIPFRRAVFPSRSDTYLITQRLRI